MQNYSSKNRIGIIGGGQLGFMLGVAAYQLGIIPSFFDPNPDSPAFLIGKGTIAPFNHSDQLLQFASQNDVVTYEFENIAASDLDSLSSNYELHPNPIALLLSQDRLLEKKFFAELGVETAPYRAISTEAELNTALEELGGPCILKTRTLGYDGKGQLKLNAAHLSSSAETRNTATALLEKPCIVEQQITFTRELSIVACRDKNGAIVFYPLVENLHKEGILRRTIAPAPNVAPHIEQAAQEIAAALLEGCNYCGTLAIEFFTDEEKLLANEFAPRVHNSGHWSLNGAVTSQFENHIRAVCGLPLGATSARGVTIMFNIVGTLPRPEGVLGIPHAHLHLYHKAPRPQRKIGHINITADSLQEADARVRSLFAAVPEIAGLIEDT